MDYVIDYLIDYVIGYLIDYVFGYLILFMGSTSSFLKFVEWTLHLLSRCHDVGHTSHVINAAAAEWNGDEQMVRLHCELVLHVEEFVLAC